MKQKWQKTYEWDLNRTEKDFDKLLRDNGFEIVGVKMFVTKTDWLVQKDGVRLEYSIIKEAPSAKLCWKSFIDYYNVKKQYQALLET